MLNLVYSSELTERRLLWPLESDMIFLNHGSYGATPHVVLEEQQRWRDALERQPVRFINQDLPVALRAARDQLAQFLSSVPEALAFVENTTGGIGAVLRSLDFKPGDRIVITDHIYNAIRQTLLHLCERSGAVLEIVTLGLPVASPEAVAEQVCTAIDASVRLVVIDHVASASALLMPVEPIVAHCRWLGVAVLVDGSHAPGMVDLDLDQLDADYYVGNCHKWLCAPKGAAFLRLAERAREGIHPLAISHQYGRGFPEEFFMVGTRDASAQLSVPAAIAFHQQLGGAALRRSNHERAVEAGRRIAERLGTTTGAPAVMMGAMATIAMPAAPGAAPATREEANALKARLWDEDRIEVHVMPFAARLWVRVCMQAYNDLDETDILANRLANLAGL